MTWIGYTYALYWNCRDDCLYVLSSTAGHEPQISMHTDYMLSGAAWRLIAGRIAGRTAGQIVHALGNTVVLQLEVKYMHAVSFALTVFSDF